MVRPLVGLTALAAGVLAAVAIASPGQPGAVDTTFAANGVASWSSGPAASLAFVASQALQPDGKIVLVGPTTPDPQSGDTQMCVVRLNPDGSLDSTFGSGTGAVLIGFGGGASATATAVALQQNNDIVVVGAESTSLTSRIGVARLTPSGALDTTFNSSGRTTVDTDDTDQGSPRTVGVAVQPADQKIVVAGTRSVNGTLEFQVSRLTTGGQPDGSFNTTGTATTQIGSGDSSAAVVAVQGNGRIVVAGTGTAGGARHFQVARYLDDGTLDSSFNASGSPAGTEDIPVAGEDAGEGASVQAMALQPSDGKIVLAGGPRGGPQVGFGSVQPGHAALVRLNPDGTLDATFAGGGQSGGEVLLPFPGSTADTANAVTIDPVSGKLLVAGTAELTVQGNQTGEIVADRVNPDGSLDATFGDPGMTALGQGGASAAQLLHTAAHAVDALIGGIVGSSAGAIAVTAEPPPTTTGTSTGSGTGTGTGSGTGATTGPTSTTPTGTGPTSTGPTSTTPTGTTSTTTTTTTCQPPSVVERARDPQRGEVLAVGRGQPFAYVITVSNPGSCALSKLTVSDVLPRAFAWSGPAASGATFAPLLAAAVPPRISSPTSGQALVSAPALPAGESLTVLLRGHATAVGRQSDTATVTAVGLPAVRSNGVILDVTTLPTTQAVSVTARQVTGTASAGPAGPEATLSRVARVEVAVRALRIRGRPPPRRCLWLDGAGRLASLARGSSGKCDAPLWLRAAGLRVWTYRFGRRLPAGGYQLLVRVTNRAGVYDTTFAARRHNLVAFTLP